MSQSRKDFVIEQANEIKKDFRQHSLDTWKWIDKTVPQIEAIEALAIKFGCNEKEVIPFSEIKEGLKKFKAALDAVITDFS